MFKHVFATLLLVLAASAAPVAPGLAMPAAGERPARSNLGLHLVADTATGQQAAKAEPDPLGVHLPGTLSAQVIVKLLVPEHERATPKLVGAKPWPGHIGLYVAIVCIGGSGGYGGPGCTRSNDAGEAPLRVYLGVIALAEGVPPQVVAASGAIDDAMDWTKSGLPREPSEAGDLIRPDQLDRFDLAPYRITAETPAFGLRGSWLESYSGGGAEFDGLYLFAPEGDRLKRVLAVPMSAYANIAGDWHKDGTRDHQITDTSNILIVSPHATAGHFDLVIKGKGRRWQRKYSWSAAAGAYRPAGP